MLKKSILLALLCVFSFSYEMNKEVEALIKTTQENMVFVKGGSFIMGDPLFIDNQDRTYEGEGAIIIGSPENKKKYPDAHWEPITFGHSGKGQHKVTLSDFSMQKYMVTWKEFDVYSKFKNQVLLEKKWIGRRDWRKENHAVRVHWQESKDYCQWLGKQTGKNFDLPTEAQWEYAARSRGEYVTWATNDGSANNGTTYTYGKVKNMEGYGETEIGLFKPNPLGLYDMSGLSYRWVNDWYSKDYYEHSSELNPQGPKSGTIKVLRSGGGSSVANSIVFKRYYIEPKGKYRIPGFRCVINP